MKKLVFAVAGLAISIVNMADSAVQAADLAVKAFQPPPPAAVWNWSGPYLGLGVGARFSQSDANIAAGTVGTAPLALPAQNDVTFSNIAGRFSIYGGWNWQVTPFSLIGVEGDYGWANKTSTSFGSPEPSRAPLIVAAFPFGGTANDSYAVKTTWDGSVRLRAGVLANPSTLFYVTGGAAWTQLQATSTCATVSAPFTAGNCTPGGFQAGTLQPAVISHSDTRVGWTVGGGIEVLLWSNWMARAQYRYSDFGKVSFTDLRSCSNTCTGFSPVSFTNDLHQVQHLAEFGLSYKFGGL